MAKYAMTTDTMTSPYRGLTPYTEADAAYFFGRTREIATIAANLEVSRLTIFYGPSGVGKSSVLRAGVIHQLRQRARQNVQTGGTAELIPIYFNRWQTEPMAGLVQAVAEGIAAVVGEEREQEDKATRRQGDKETADSLPVAPHSAPDTPQSFTAYLREQSERTGSDLLLVLDQFEEYFLYHPDEAGPGSFAYELVNALTTPDLRVNFMLALREDALARLDRFKGQVPFLLDNRLSIGHLGRAAGEEAIRKPLEQHNKTALATIAIEPALVAAVLDQVGSGRVALSKQGAGGRGDAGTGEAIEAPYLQLVMTRLWEQEQANHSISLRQTTLDSLGGAETIVRNYLDNTLAALDPTDQTLAATFFDRLVTPSGTKIALALDELAQYAAREPATVERLLNQLQDRRLLRGVQSPGGVTQYEIFHDVLGQALLDWQARYQKAQEENTRLVEEQVARAEAEQRAAAAAELTKLEGEARRQAQLRAAMEQRNSRRLRWLLALVGALLIGAVSLAIFAFNAQRTAFDAQATAEANAAEAEKQAQIAFIRQLAAQSDAAVASSYPRSLLLAVEAVTASRRITPALALGAAATALHARLEGQTGSIPLVGHKDSVTSVAFSVDGQWLASGSHDTTVRIWRVGDWQAKPLVLRSQEGRVTSVAFSADGQWLVSGSSDKTLRVWSVNNWQAKPLVLHGHENGVTSVAFSIDGQWLASGSYDSTVRIWRVNDWQTEPLVLRGHTSGVTAVAFSADGQWLASGSDDSLKVWTVNDWRAEPLVLHGSDIAIASVTFSAASNGHPPWLVANNRNSILQVWTVNDWQAEPLELRGNTRRGGMSVAISPARSEHSQWLASSSFDNKLDVWRVNEWQVEPLGLDGHESTVTAVAFSADGQWLASGSSDATVRVWQVNDWQVEPTVLSGHGMLVWSVAVSADGQWLAGGDENNTVSVWPVHDRQTAPIVLRGHAAAVIAVAFSAESTGHPQWLASGSHDHTVRVWRVGDWQAEPAVLRGHKSEVTSVAFSMDGQWLASSSWDSTVRVWQVNNWQLEPVVLRGHQGEVTSVAFSVDGQWLASGSNDSTVRIWRVGDWQAKPLVLRSHEGSVTSVAFSTAPRGYPQWLASGSLDSTVRIWRVGDWQTKPLVLRSHEIGVTSVAFSGAPSGSTQWLASGSYDKTLRIWQVNNWQIEPVVLRAHEDTVTSVVFSPAANGRSPWLLSGSYDGTVRLWTVSLASLGELACRLSGRNFTQDEWQQYFDNAPYGVTCPQWPIDPSVAEAVIAEGRNLAQKGDMAGATAKFEQALQLNSDLNLDPQLLAQIEWGRGLAADGVYTQAMATFAAVQVISPTVDITTNLDGPEWFGICWQGIMDAAAHTVLSACERAAARESDVGDYYDSRGIARALTGDVAGAIADLELAVQLWQEIQMNEAGIAERTAFITDLRAGKPPKEIFTEETLTKLYEESGR